MVQFVNAYLACRISVTPKVHIIIAHLKYFVERFGPLGLYSEQAGEAIHTFFKKTWKKYFVYWTNLKRAIAEFNGKNTK